MAKTNDELAEQAAECVINALETPIAGQPSVKVLHRANAIRVVKAALLVVFEEGHGPAATDSWVDRRLPQRRNASDS